MRGRNDVGDSFLLDQECGTNVLWLGGQGLDTLLSIRSFKAAKENHRLLNTRINARIDVGLARRGWNLRLS